jgi:hypothetical protein
MNNNLSKKIDIAFIASSRDYHAMDWYRTVRDIMPQKNIVVLTDLIEGEGVEKIINENDYIIKIGNVDKFLFNYQSTLGNLWRNLIKLIFAINFAVSIRNIDKKNRNCVFHAHSMYYIFVCWLSGIRFIATPMGSDTLIRPDESFIYKYFYKKALLNASVITVDSEKMQKKIKSLTKKKSDIIQNGVDVLTSIDLLNKNKLKRSKIISVRAFAENYQISELIKERNNTLKTVNLEFIHPFSEKQYLDKIDKEITSKDKIHGFLSKKNMSELFLKSYVAISIPRSDSSPRTVYEAIFHGCIVVATYDDWYNSITNCMKSRIILVNINKKFWLSTSIKKAKILSKIIYSPTKEAIDKFDQFTSMKKMCKKYYEIN